MEVVAICRDCGASVRGEKPDGTKRTLRGLCPHCGGSARLRNRKDPAPSANPPPLGTALVRRAVCKRKGHAVAAPDDAVPLRDLCCAVCSGRLRRLGTSGLRAMRRRIGMVPFVGCRLRQLALPGT